MNILFSSAGRRVELINCFRHGAATLKLPVRIVAADMNPEISAACRSADAFHTVPACNHPDFVERIKEICRHENAVLVVPTIDTELRVIAELKERHGREFGKIVVPFSDVVAIAGDKQRTRDVLRNLGISTPATLRFSEWKLGGALKDRKIILKPIDGSASTGIIRPKTVDEAMTIPDNGRLIVQELIEGKEYTVNAYYSRLGKLLCAIPHLRIEVRAGEVSKGRTEHVSCLEDAARIMGEGIPGLEGPICFQAIVRDDGSYAIFEINARFGGGYPLAHHAGATFSKWLIEEALGLPSTANNNWREGVTMLRYDSAVFLG